MQEGGWPMEGKHEQRPATVAEAPKQAGEAPARREPWWWVERGVWTEAMLTRLASSEPANRVWFTLVDKTYAPANLQRAYEKVWRNGGCAGADEQTVAHFGRHAEAELRQLHEQLRTGRYRPQPVLRGWIAKPGSSERRPLGIPAVRDRIVQGALKHVLEPILEAEFAEHSYGFRPGRGAKDALRRVDTLIVDKTGTLTEGKPRFERVVGVGGFEADDALRLAASLDQGSEHPLAMAIVSEARARSLLLEAPVGFDSASGMGVRGQVAGKPVALGNEALMAQVGVDVSAVSQQVDAARSEGASVK